MPKSSAKVVRLHPCHSDRALESLNRITGLRFSRWPESLVDSVTDAPLSIENRQQRGYGAPPVISQALA